MKKRILFVDDEQRALDGLRRMLYSLRGEWDVEFAIEGEKALSILESHPFDALVTDLRMPGMDGHTLLQIAQKRHPGMVRLVLSAFAPRLTVFSLLPHAHGFLVRPCDSNMLIATLSRRLALRELMGTDRVRAMVLGIGTLPVMPETLEHLVTVVTSADPSSEHLEELVMSDVALTAELLRFTFFIIERIPSIEASAATALASVRHADLNEMLTAHIFHALPETVVKRFEVREWVTHGVAMAQAITEAFRNEGSYSNVPADVLLTGFLHDIGQWVLLSAEPEPYADVWKRHRESGAPLHEIEKEVFGATHAEIAGFLLGFWGFPDSMVDAVSHHHSQPGFGETVSSLRKAVYSAEAAALHAEKR